KISRPLPSTRANERERIPLDEMAPAKIPFEAFIKRSSQEFVMLASRFKLMTQLVLALALLGTPPSAAQAQTQTDKPNILFIMGDDIGWMQPSIYHRGLMVGDTPNIDRIGKEGSMFVDYVAMQSCTSGRNAFFTGMYPVRTGMIPPQLPGSPSYL